MAHSVTMKSHTNSFQDMSRNTSPYSRLIRKIQYEMSCQFRWCKFIVFLQFQFDRNMYYNSKPTAAIQNVLSFTSQWRRSMFDVQRFDLVANGSSLSFIMIFKGKKYEKFSAVMTSKRKIDKANAFLQQRQNELISSMEAEAERVQRQSAHISKEAPERPLVNK